MAKQEKLSSDYPTSAPTSQQDMERRLTDGFQEDSVLASRRTFVNPDPFGDEAYVGTDPIYQNHANDTEKPYAADGGALQKAEEQVADYYEAPEGATVVADPGMGGKAVLATATTDVADVPTAEVRGAVVHSDDVVEESVKSDSEDDKGDEEEVSPPPSGDPSLPPTPAVPSGQAGSGSPTNS